MATSLLDLLGVALIGLVGLLSAIALSGSEPPARVSEWIDSLGLEGTSLTTLAAVVAVVGSVLLLAKSFVYGYLSYLTYRFLGRTQGKVSERLAAALLRLPLPALERRPSQEVAFVLTGGASAAFLGVLGALAVILAEASLLVVLGAALLIVSPMVTLAATAFLAAVGLAVQRGLSGWSQRLGLELGTTAVISHRLIQESIATYRELTILDRRGAVTSKIGNVLGAYSSSLSQTYFVSSLPKLVYESALVLGAVLLAAWQFVTQDEVAAITTLAVFLAAGSRIIPSMLRISTQLNSLASAAGAAESTYSILASLASDAPPELDPSDRAEVPPDPGEIPAGEDAAFIAHVVLSDVTFSYPGSQTPSVVAISIDVPPGTSLALVGSTGAGKSTVADLMTGILSPDSGSVRLSGVDPTVAVRRWPGAVGFVPQSVALLDASVRENVGLGLNPREIDDDLVWESLERAQLATFLSGSRDGLDTLVGERGVKLSGGQRQRLGLARALYSRPRLLVLDEATSALDAETEEAIASAIRALSGSVTVVTVAHRLATVKLSDQVAFLSEGSLVACGRFDEVRERIPQFDRQARLLGL